MILKAKTDISKMIREQRIALGLTQEQYATKVGVTFSTVNRWENNKAKPSPLALQRINKLQKTIKQNE
jgi:putative transcriptional regulator